MKEKLNLKDIIFFAIIFLMAIGCVAGKFYSDSKDEREAKEKNAQRIVGVHIKGEVENPGYYELSYGSRIKDAIEIADGATKEADVDSVNLAQKVADGEEIIIPKKLSSDEISKKNESRININTATVYELCSLHGVGTITAEKIIAYREKTGGFKKIEELKKVDGISASTYNDIKDKIIVE